MFDYYYGITFSISLYCWHSHRLWLAKINNEIPTYVIQSLPFSPLCLCAILEKDMWPRLGSSFFFVCGCICVTDTKGSAKIIFECLLPLSSNRMVYGFCSCFSFVCVLHNLAIKSQWCVTVTEAETETQWCWNLNVRSVHAVDCPACVPVCVCVVTCSSYVWA